jgi:hypothetical protein
MNVLIDECIPRKFKKSLSGHACKTVPEAGLAGLKNGALLTSAEKLGFDVFLTMDKGVEHAQNLVGRAIAVVIIRAKSNRLADLLPHAAECVTQITHARKGQVARVG